MWMTKRVEQALFAENIGMDSANGDELAEESTEEATLNSSAKVMKNVLQFSKHKKGTDLVEKGRINELMILHWLTLFGWLTTKQLLWLVWERECAKRSCEIALNNLRKKGFVVTHRAPNGMPAHFTTIRAANYLKENYKDAKAASVVSTRAQYKKTIEKWNRKIDNGAKKGITKYKHRMACNWIAIWLKKMGYVVWTEHQVARRQDPVGLYEGKLPDLVLKASDCEEERYVLVEVEHSRRNKKDTKEFVDWMINVQQRWCAMMEYADETRVQEIWLMYPNDERHFVGTILNELVRRYASEDTPDDDKAMIKEMRGMSHALGFKSLSYSMGNGAIVNNWSGDNPFAHYALVDHMDFDERRTKEEDDG